MCGLDITFVKSILYKRIVTKFFWDYCLNSRVCNYGKRVVIELLQTVIIHFLFHILDVNVNEWVLVKGYILRIWTDGPYVVSTTYVETLDEL